MSCSFGGRRVALIVSDGRIVIREKAVKDDIASFPPCGALSISLNGKFFVNKGWTKIMIFAFKNFITKLTK